MVIDCPVCCRNVNPNFINAHLDSGCESHIEPENEPSTPGTQQPAQGKTPKVNGFSGFFQRFSGSQAPCSTAPPKLTSKNEDAQILNHEVPRRSTPQPRDEASSGNLCTTECPPSSALVRSTAVRKRSLDDIQPQEQEPHSPSSKRPKTTNTPSALKRSNTSAPLADRLRPTSLSQVTGQDSLINLLNPLIQTSRIPSLILWGGPGTGKTTIARLIAKEACCRYVEINSTSTGVQECKRIFADARNELHNGLTPGGRRTIVFCDEIHRFSKSQQDVFLAPVERGDVILIGATTENPSFKVINALLSRTRVFVLDLLSDESIVSIISRAVDTLTEEASHDVNHDESLDPLNTDAIPRSTTLHSPALHAYIASTSRGDARAALNLLDQASALLYSNPTLPLESIKQSLLHTLTYDRAGDNHYDTISAFHKSVRGSSADASLYYLARMLSGGEDPLFIARRMVVIASEDVGLADNAMLPLATATYAACERIGMPECRINLAHCAVALALAPKSVRSYRGLSAAMACVSEEGAIGAPPIPLHLRNAPTRLMKGLGYSEGYKYNPEFKGGRVKQEYLPEGLRGRIFLVDRDLGEEVDPDVQEREDARAKRGVGEVGMDAEKLRGGRGCKEDGAGEDWASGGNTRVVDDDLDLQVEL